ncbi:ribosome maturation factor RimM [Camelliibacillus cellulosilyticus]|uniref:Ribosome maturation factor RimM n=1 Tax=Camelliibacillus cellulosilyticus TaxID=2174486 RepID=A0ABV9GGB5_9BACL
MTEWYDVGKIVNTHGIKGEVRVISRTDFPEERYQSGSVLYVGKNRDSEKMPLTVSGYRRHKQFDLLTFDGLASINEVEHLKGLNLYVSENQLHELADHEYYYHEIIGCQVFSEDGSELGKIAEILAPGANDVWVVKRKGKKDLLIPYIEDVVKSVDTEAKKVVVHLMDGLLDDED